MSEPIARIQFDFTQEDYIEAQLSLTPPFLSWYRQPNFLLLAFCMVLFVPAFVFLRTTLLTVSTGLILGVCALATIALPLVWKLETKRWHLQRISALERRYVSWDCSKKGYVAELSEDGFTVSCDCGTDSRFWRAMRKHLDPPNLILAIGSNGQFYLFPKRAFTSDQLAGFRELLRRKLAAK